MEVGDTLKGGRWRLDRLLGTGGAAAVYAATHRNGTRAAIKILDAELLDDEQALRRFLREGYVANTVGHPGVVRVIDDDVEDGRAYLVMELLDGESLDERRRMSKGKLPLNEVMDLTLQLLDVLAAAHDKGIIHRDIKPGNLFVTKDGRLKVLDFGLAKMRQELQGESTAIGTVLGTPGFLAPELARGEVDEVGPRTDLFSVGATAFKLLSGEHIYPAKGMALVGAAVAEQPRPIASVVRGLPTEVASVIDRALAFDPADRWADAREMRRALEDALRAQSTTEPENRLVSVVDWELDGTEPTVAARAPESERAPSGRQVPPTTRQPNSAVPQLYDADEVAEARGPAGTKVMLHGAHQAQWAAPRAVQSPPRPGPQPPAPRAPVPLALWVVLAVVVAALVTLVLMRR